MKTYTVQVGGAPYVDVECENDTDAVDAAREVIAAKRGPGEYAVAVRCGAREVSEFGFTVPNQGRVPPGRLRRGAP